MPAASATIWGARLDCSLFGYAEKWHVNIVLNILYFYYFYFIFQKCF